MTEAVNHCNQVGTHYCTMFSSDMWSIFSTFYITVRGLIWSLEYSLRHALCHAHRRVAILLATLMWAWHAWLNNICGNWQVLYAQLPNHNVKH